MNLLARREHSTSQLRRKLNARGMEGVVVDDTLQALAEERLLSDERFIESLVRSRIAKGYGPLRIRAELREHGIGDEQIGNAVDVNAEFWRDRVVDVRRKRFGTAPPADLNERAKEARFLQYRGFTSEQIRAALKQADSDE